VNGVEEKTTLSPWARRFERLRSQFQLGFVLLRKGRITPRKIWNAARNAVAFSKRNPVSGNGPTVALFDVSSHCNLYCVTCRTSRTDLIDMIGQVEEKPTLGNMKFERFTRIIDDLHKDMLLAALYTSGEPLLNKQIYEMVAYAGQRGLATMISSNGMLATPEVAEKLIKAGLDYFKVAVSGSTQEVYQTYHRGGEIKTILDNMASFSALRRKLGIPCVLVIDYILFEHNRHQAAAIRQFCHEHDLTFSLRYGRVLPGTGIESPKESESHFLPKSGACDWLWNIMSFCVDGSAVPCCRFATCAKSPFVFGVGGDENAREIWNNDKMRQFRTIHARDGRSNLPMCGDCFYSGVDFQS
jgi:MoaA/NifB/PqqE/SkfB family radical SAM enzyme